MNMTQIFDRFSILDPKREEDQVEAALAKKVFDRFSILDPERARAQVEAGAGKSMFDQFSALDPARSERQMEANIGGGGGGYVAKAVRLADDTRVGRAGLAIPDNSKFILSYWYKISSDTPDTNLINVSDSSNNTNPNTFQNINDDNGPSDMIFDCYDASGNNEFTIVSNLGAFVAGSWVHVFSSGDTNFSAGNKKGFVYIQGVDALNALNDSSPAFNIGWNGYKFGVPSFDIAFTIRAKDYCDVQMWVGAVADPALHIGKFISGGKPVDPAVPAAAFGQQTFLCSGDKDGFGTNQGTGGAFTTTGTAIVNASTSPSN